MPHPLVLAVFAHPKAAAAAARELHELGVTREDLSVVARSHDEEARIVRRAAATPGAEMEDSIFAGRLGALAGRVLAAVAVVMPGIGPIVAGGPLGAKLGEAAGEAAGHATGGVEGVLEDAGVDPDRAEAIRDRVEQGAVLLGVHVRGSTVDQVRRALERSGADDLESATWE